MGFGFALAKGRPRNYLDLVRDHEDGIEAYSEAADDIGCVRRRGLFRIFGLPVVFGRKACKKILGTGFGYGSKVFSQFFGVHAKTGIGNCKGFGVLVQCYAYFKIKIWQSGQFAAVYTEAHLVKGIGCVGNQLTQKNFAVCIEGMGENMQYLAYFGAKFTFFIAFFRHFVLRYILHGTSRVCAILSGS